MQNFLNFIEALFFLISFIGAPIAVIYTFYMTWFRPSDFQEQLPKRIKGRGPIADYFREWYASSVWLWINRLASLFFVLVIGFLIGGALLHFLGVIP
jgi:hypothetical protein